MQPVDHVGQVMQVLRRQMAENLERMRGSGHKAAVAAPGTRPAGAPPVAPTLRQAVARRIKAIHPDDPRRLHTATAVLVEAVLLAEFGEGLVNDPEFRDLMRQVQSAMLADPALADELGRLVAQLGQG